MKRLPISVCIITKDEERRIRACLEGVAGRVDEIVVLDSLSKDRTQAIAREFTPRVHERPFEDFSSQKNRCVALASRDWVLVLDADERIPEEAWPAVARALARARRDGTAAFAIPRLTRFIDGRFHRWVAYNPNFQWRLFDRRRCRYTGRVHEALEVSGRRGCVRAEFIHESDRLLEEYGLKAALYRRLKQAEGAQPSPPLATRLNRKIRDFLFYLRVFVVDLGYPDRGPHDWFLALAWLGILLVPPLRRLFVKDRLFQRRYALDAYLHGPRPKPLPLADLPGCS